MYWNPFRKIFLFFVQCFLQIKLHSIPSIFFPILQPKPGSFCFPSLPHCQSEWHKNVKKYIHQAIILSKIFTHWSFPPFLVSPTQSYYETYYQTARKAKTDAWIFSGSSAGDISLGPFFVSLHETRLSWHISWLMFRKSWQ